MGYDYWARGEHAWAGGELAETGVAPGKTSLTSRLGSGSGAAIQRKHDGGDGFYPDPALAAGPSRVGLGTGGGDPFGVHLSSGPAILRSAAHAPEAGRDPGEIFGAATGGAGSEIPFRAEMERSFGEDFSAVSAHVGQGQAMQALGAHAAAQGETVAFATASPTRELVAHELTHVVQHRYGGAAGVASKALSSPDDASEREADAVAARVAAGERVQVGGSGGAGAGGERAESACGCAGAGCAACGKGAAAANENVSRSVVQRAAAGGGAGAGAGGGAAGGRAAIEQAMALVAGPARQATQSGNPAAAADKARVLDLALAQLAQAGNAAPAADGAAAEGPGGEPLAALVAELQAGFARKAPAGAPPAVDGEAEPAATPGPRAKAGPGAEAAQQAQPAGGIIQRQVAPPPFDCDGLLAQIIEFLNVLKERSAELIADARNLQWDHWGVGDAHPTYGSVEGHQDQFRGRQRGLRRRLNDWNSNNCGGGLPVEAWDWATRPVPSPTPRTNPATQRAAETVAVGVGVGVGVYIAYRVLRMIPSLFPPLWPTIPVNLAVP